MSATIGVAITVLLTLALNAFATFRVGFSDLYTPAQKRMQFAMIWVVPVAGAILVLTVIMSDTSRRNSSSGDGSEIGNDGWMDNHGHNHHLGDLGHGGDGGANGR